MNALKIDGMSLKVLSKFRVAAVEITPEQCLKIKNNMTDAQRNESPAKKAEYAKQMLANQFPLTNDALVYSKATKTWLNGQHRTGAGSDAKTGLQVLVLEVDDESIMKVIDGGKPRSIGDAVVSLGYIRGRVLSGVGSVWLSYKRGLLTPLTDMGKSSVGHRSSERIVTRQERIAFCQKHAKTILSAVAYVENMVKHEGVPTLNLAATAYCIIQGKDGEDAAKKYLTELITGVNASGPATACRRALIRSMRGSRYKLGFTTKLGMILKAYTYEKAGRAVSSLILKNNEPFPVV